MAWPSSTFVTTEPEVDFRGGSEPRVFVDWLGNYAQGYTDGFAAGIAAPTTGQLWPRGNPA